MEYHKGCAVPFFFIFYINDITMVPWSMSLYADDLALYHPIYSTTDYHLLQNDMDKLCVWSDVNA